MFNLIRMRDRRYPAYIRHLAVEFGKAPGDVVQALDDCMEQIEDHEGRCKVQVRILYVLNCER